MPGHDVGGIGRESERLLLVVEQKVPLLADDRGDLLGELGEQPGKADFKPHVVFKRFNLSVCRLTERTHAKVNGIAVPRLCLDREYLPEVSAGAAEPRPQPVNGVLLSKMVGNRNGEGR